MTTSHPPSESLAATRAIQASPDYLSLVVAFPLVAIRTDAQLDDAVEVIDGLLDKGTLSEGEEQYLDALSVLVEAYEREHIPFPAVSGIDALRHIMEENGLRQRDLLDVFETRSVASEVIDGKRPLTMNHIRRLSERFGLPAEVFFGS